MHSKRRGLDKAIHQLEQALNDAKTSSDSPDNESSAAQRLQQLLGEAGAVLNREQSRRSTATQSPSSSRLDNPITAPQLAPSRSVVLQQGGSRQVVEDTENPLQLLAHATEQCLPLPQLSHGQNWPTAAITGQAHSRGDKSHESLRNFFGPPRVNLDVGPSLDPISLGFVTSIEAEDLVN